MSGERGSKRRKEEGKAEWPISCCELTWPFCFFKNKTILQRNKNGLFETIFSPDLLVLKPHETLESEAVHASSGKI